MEVRCCGTLTGQEYGADPGEGGESSACGPEKEGHQVTRAADFEPRGRWHPATPGAQAQRPLSWQQGSMLSFERKKRRQPIAAVGKPSQDSARRTSPGRFTHGLGQFPYVGAGFTPPKFYFSNENLYKEKTDHVNYPGVFTETGFDCPG